MVNVVGRNRASRPGAGGSKGGFVYRPRKAEDIKKRAERTGGRFDSPFKDGFDQWRAKGGDNLIRFLPATWDDADHYGFTIWVHKFIGADNSNYLCPLKMMQKKCPMCAAAKDAKDAGDKEEAKALAASEQIVSWIIDRDEESDTPLLYPMSWTMDRDISALTYNKRSGKVLLIEHPDEGYDITIKRSGTGLKTKYFGLSVDRDKTPISDDPKVQDEILDFIHENPIPSTLKYYDYDYLEKVLMGGSDEKEEGEDVGDNTDGEVDGRSKGRQARQEGREARQDRRRPAARDEGEGEGEYADDAQGEGEGEYADDGQVEGEGEYVDDGEGGEGEPADDGEYVEEGGGDDAGDADPEETRAAPRRPAARGGREPLRTREPMRRPAPREREERRPARPAARPSREERRPSREDRGDRRPAREDRRPARPAARPAARPGRR